MTAGVVIRRGHNGPPNSAQGGFACAVFARATDLAPPLVVTLLAPPPLDTTCQVVTGARRATVSAGGTLVATVSPAGREPDPAPPVSAEEAETASAGFRGETDHPFPTCFVCGHQRRDGTGLRLAPGPVPHRPGMAACLWTPDGHAGDPVPEEVVWGVLDCPGGWI
ncbi:MAG TPA: hypothetical protein VNP92_29965, partial [Actinophytocola sp.]|nr:hypothetical protein [Actinophytocola sp.]